MEDAKFLGCDNCNPTDCLNLTTSLLELLERNKSPLHDILDSTCDETDADDDAEALKADFYAALMVRGRCAVSKIVRKE